MLAVLVGVGVGVVAAVLVGLGVVAVRRLAMAGGQGVCPVLGCSTG